MNQADQEYLE